MTPAARMRSLLRRINGKLHAQGKREALKATRGERSRSELGDFYLLCWHTNTIRDTRVDPVRLGFELGVLTPEELADFAARTLAGQHEGSP